MKNTSLYLKKDSCLMIMVVTILFLPAGWVPAQVNPAIRIVHETDTVRPLQKVMIVCTKPGTLVVRDGKNTEYFRKPAATIQSVTAGGAPGRHSVILLDTKGKETDIVFFNLKAMTLPTCCVKTSNPTG